MRVCVPNFANASSTGWRRVAFTERFIKRSHTAKVFGAKAKARAKARARAQPSPLPPTLAHESERAPAWIASQRGEKEKGTFGGCL